MANTPPTGAAPGAGGSFPWMYAATTAINTIGAVQSSRKEVSQIEAAAGQQISAAMQATEDFQLQAMAQRQQQALAVQRDELAQRADTEAQRQARLVTEVDVTAGPTLAAAREARMRRRRFFDQE